MTHDHSLGEPTELAALYATGALAGAERAAFEAHLESGCAECLTEVRQSLDVALALAATVAPVDPPPRLRQALLARVAKNRAQSSASPLAALWPQRAGAPAALQTIRADSGVWEESAVPGVQIRVLSVDRARDQFTALVRMAPGAKYPRHAHRGPEHCLVLEGDLRVEGETLRAGDYQVAPAGSGHGEQSSENGCLLYIASSLSDEFA